MTERQGLAVVVGAVLLIAIATGHAAAGALPPVPWDVAKLSVAPKVLEVPAGIPVPEGVHALCYEGVPFRGKPTRVFAWYAVPKDASAAHPVPGIILVHGAGGSAFAEWVKLWTSRGYAAIAPDLGGNFPIGKFNNWQHDAEGGPNLGSIPQLEWPVTDQWMYQAVSEVLLAHSFLASLPGVDSQRIGITGLSWGGVVTATVAAVDPRLKFAVSVYGCGFISDEADDGSCFVGLQATAAQRAAWRRLWDPANFLSRLTVPMLWLGGADDFAFTPKARQLSYRAAPGPRTVTLLPRLAHNQEAGESPAIIRAFADSIVRGGVPPVRVTGQGIDTATREAWTTFDKTAPLKRADLIFTRDAGRWQDRKWESVPAAISGQHAMAMVPQDAVAYYFNLTDDRGLVVSSEYGALPHP